MGFDVFQNLSISIKALHTQTGSTPSLNNHLHQKYQSNDIVSAEPTIGCHIAQRSVDFDARMFVVAELLEVEIDELRTGIGDEAKPVAPCSTKELDIRD